MNSGLAKFAFKFKAVCVAVETGLLASLVLSTFDNPTSEAVYVGLSAPIHDGLLVMSVHVGLLPVW